MKGEVFDKFKAYKALVENQIDMKIKTLRSDNGGEFVSKKFDNFLHECGIQRQTNAPYTPQQNGVTERANRTILECARNMIRAQGLDLEFWAEAVNTGVYIKNRCPTKVLESNTPQEAWTGRKPDVFHLRVFGCKTFAHIFDSSNGRQNHIFNGDLEEEIYMEQPEGFTQKGEHLVCKLHKSLYELKQSSRAWNQKLDVFCKNIKFVRSDVDFSMYITQVGDVIIVVYVNDLILVCNNKDKLLQVKEELFRKFEMKDLGDLHFFLCMEVERGRAQRLLYINQIRYLKEVLKCFCMDDCKAIRMPLDPKTKLKKNEDKDDEMVKVPYQQVVGSLMYAILCTRPDLAYPINVVSQHMANPSLEHWIAVKCIFRYLQGTLQFKLCFRGLTPQGLVGYCDADWADDLEDRRSTTRFVFMMGGGTISWSSKRQPTIVLSTTEVEYMASMQATKEAIWIAKFMKELGYMKKKKAMVIRCDNQGAISLTKNPRQYARTKHIDVQHHFVREQVENAEVILE